MSIIERIAWINGILLVISETLPLLNRDITEATSLLTLISITLRKIKAKKGE